MRSGSLICLPVRLPASPRARSWDYWTILKLILAVVIALVLLRIGLAMLRGLARPVPEPPPPGEMRKVDFRYRCSICGAEARLTLAPDADPEAPRHCLEDMQLVTPVDD